MQRDAQGARDVIVASPCGAQPIRRGRHESVVGPTGEHAQGFKRGRYIGPLQTVVTMLPLGKDIYQTLCLQPLQVDTGGRRGNVSDHRKLGAGSCTSVQQAVEHAGACGLADGCRNAGDRSVNLSINIHSLMINEVFMLDNWHIAEYSFARAGNRETGRREAIGVRVATGALCRWTGSIVRYVEKRIDLA